MATDRWENLKEVFEKALELSGNDRELFFQQLSSSDPQLCAALRQLISNHEAVGEFLELDDTRHAGIFLPGQVIASRYTTIRQIGRGGMGEVYEAIDTAIGERVALKTVRHDLRVGPAVVNGLIRELQLARKVTHPNVCRVFDIGRHTDSHQDTIFLTMELLEGETLAARLARDGALPPNAVLPIAQQIAAAIDAAHECGIVHRDLKPGNILMTPSGRVVITDFGLARDGSSAATISTNESGLVGTPGYISPEQTAGFRATHLSDIFSFGVVLHEMATGRKPAGTAADELRHLPSAWQSVITRCLHVEPKQRFHTALDVVRGLEHLESLADPVKTIDDADRPPQKRIRYAAAWALLPLLILLIAGAVFVPGILKPDVTTLEVFDIDNQTNDPSLDYLSKGVTSELMRRLSRIERLRIIPVHGTRSRSDERRQHPYSFDGVLESRNGGIQLTGSVIDNRDGSLIWFEKFENREENPIQIESDLAGGAIIALQTKLLGGTGGSRGGATSSLVARVRSLLPAWTEQLEAAPTTSNTALVAYMKGRYLRSQGSPELTMAAVAELKRAVSEDPRFALAYASLADAYLALTYYAYSSRTDLVTDARRSAEVAVSIDGSLAEAWEALALVKKHEWDWKGTEESYRRALDLKPSLASARRGYGSLLIQLGRPDEGVPMVRQAFALDPFNPSLPAGYGLDLFLAGQYEDCIGILEAAAQGNDALAAAHNLGDAYALLGSLATGAKRADYFDKAFEQAKRVKVMEERLRINPRADPRMGTPWSDQMSAHYFALQGDFASAEPYLARMIEDAAGGKTSPANVAMIYAAEGRTSEAIDLLERAAAMRDQFVPLTKVMPFFHRLRSEPRFQRLLAQMGLA